MTSASAVTVVPVSSFPAADDLTGTEIVPIVQDGESRRTTAQDIADLGGGGSAPADATYLTTTDETARLPNSTVLDITNLGTKNVPVVADATRLLTADDGGKGMANIGAAPTIFTVTIPNDSTEDLDIGFVFTIAYDGSAGSDSGFQIRSEGDVTLTSLVTGDVGDFNLLQAGIVTLWKVAADAWFINGVNFEAA